MRPLLKAMLIAPAPAFVLLALIGLGPAYGLLDIALSVGIAFALTYGLSMMVGLPVHWLLRRFGWSSFAAYVFGYTAALIAMIAIATISEGSPPPPLPDDNSPFATFTLKGGGWMIVFLMSEPLVAVTAALFWNFAIPDPTEA